MVEAARRVIEEAGHLRHFTEPYGHGVGLDIEDLPKIAAGGEISMPPKVPIALFQPLCCCDELSPRI